MQLVRYLFSYSIVVVVVVMIASGYYYRETLFPNLFSHVGHMSTSETTAGKTNTGGMAGTGRNSGMGGMTGTGRNSGMTDMGSMADKSMADSQQMPGHTEAMPAATTPAPAASITQPAATSEPVAQAEPIITSEPVASAETAVTPEPVVPTESIITTEPVTSAKSAVTPEPVTPSESATTLQAPVSPANQTAVTIQSDHNPRMMAADEAAKSSMPAHELTAPVSPAPVVQMPRTEAGSIPLSVQQQQEQTERRDHEAIMTARRAYWAGDYDASEQSYQQLIDRYPNEIELHGELGNVYYAQGKWASAAAAYAQVVRQLYGTGQTAQADYMLEIVTSLDKSLGDRLQQERMGTSRPQ